MKCAWKPLFFLFYVFEIFLHINSLNTILHIKAFIIINNNPHINSKSIVPTTNGSKGVFSTIAIDTKNGRSIEINASIWIMLSLDLIMLKKEWLFNASVLWCKLLYRIMQTNTKFKTSANIGIKVLTNSVKVFLKNKFQTNASINTNKK